MKGYYFVTDASLSRAGNLNDVKAAVAARVKVVQYREKQASFKKMYEEARKLRRICKNIIFLVNDRVDLALAVEADGVHLGQDDMPYGIARELLGPQKIIGLTVHTLKGARQAQKLGADYLGVSPIFATHTKTDVREPAGVALIKKISKQVSIPLIAIGGINLANAEEVIRAGADGLCAISAVVTKDNVKTEITKFQKLFR